MAFYWRNYGVNVNLTLQFNFFQRKYDEISIKNEYGESRTAQTNLSFAKIVEVIDNNFANYTKESYNVITNNCLKFARELILIIAGNLIKKIFF